MSSITTGTSGNSGIASTQPLSERIFSLDVLRGIAITGVLLITIRQLGGLSDMRQLWLQTSPHGLAYKLYFLISVLFEGKMGTMLAILFGAGIILFLQKKNDKDGLSREDAHIRRMIWLIVFGVFNAFILLWPGDMLFQFGIVGILLFGFARMKAKGLVITAMFCTLAYAGKLYWTYADDKSDFKKYEAVMAVEKKFKTDSTARAVKDSTTRVNNPTMSAVDIQKLKTADSLAAKKDTLTKEQAEQKGKWTGKQNSFKFDMSVINADEKAMRGSWGKVWNHLLQKSKGKQSWWFYQIGVWETAAAVCWGMALLALGIFSSRFPSSRLLLIAVLGIAGGLALAWFRMHSKNAALMNFDLFIGKRLFPYNQFYPFERLIAATGYTAMFLWLIRQNILKWLWQAFACAGRMALSNYILQIICCTFFYYGYGFGYYGHQPQKLLYAVVAEIWLIQFVFSVFWLRYFQRGPVEWAWHCLVYRKWLPNRLSAEAASTQF